MIIEATTVGCEPLNHWLDASLFFYIAICSSYTLMDMEEEFGFE